VAATVGSVPGGLPAELARLEQLSRAPGVTGHSGPFPVTFAALRVGSRTANVMAEGRDQGPARSLATRAEPVSYLLNVKLAHPASAELVMNE